MSEILSRNQEYAKVLKDAVKLRYEPVAIKLVKDGEAYPEGYAEPAEQMSYCQSVFKAREGASFKMPLASHNCNVGASALGMVETPEKVASGEFHLGVGIHDSQDAVAKMISDRSIVKDKVVGTVVCPLKDADFEPDVVAFIDVPERIYWIAVALPTAKDGGRMEFSTSPFQCVCEDVTALPVCTGAPSISLGCFGCRKKNPFKADEMACGVPYAMIPGYVEHLGKYVDGVLAKAKRD